MPWFSLVVLRPIGKHRYLRSFVSKMLIETTSAKNPVSSNHVKQKQVLLDWLAGPCQLCLNSMQECFIHGLFDELGNQSVWINFSAGTDHPIANDSVQLRTTTLSKPVGITSYLKCLHISIRLIRTMTNQDVRIDCFGFEARKPLNLSIF